MSFLLDQMSNSASTLSVRSKNVPVETAHSISAKYSKETAQKLQEIAMGSKKGEVL